MSAPVSRSVDALSDRIGRALARRLMRGDAGGGQTPSEFGKLAQTLQPGDVLLIDGQSVVGQAVKYLTQSTWSHAALYVGDALGPHGPTGERHDLVEVNLGEGCVSAPLSKYARVHTRICRPAGLSDADRVKVARYMIDHIGLKYDLRNIFDLLRYVLPRPPVPQRWRRRMLALGSGDPTRAICSSLIAKAFQSVGYPILPTVREVRLRTRSQEARRELLHIRHHSLYAPRDFDLSPYFEVVKPHLAHGFDHRALVWAHHVPDEVGGAEVFQLAAE